MSSPFEKVRLKVAAGKSNKIDLSHEVITTQDFGFNKPIMCQEMVPGDKFDIHVQAFTRLAPMSTPTYGSVSMYLRAFFVPTRMITGGFYEFLSGLPYTNGGNNVSPSVPYVTNKELVLLFVNATPSWGYPLVASVDPNDAYDFLHNNNYYKFSSFGKRVYDLLVNLGYMINFTERDETKMSMLPLLSFLKIFRDHLIPSQYNATAYQSLDKYFKRSGGAFTYTDIEFMLDSFVSIYDPDYFTSAYQTPNNPNSDFNDATQLNVPGTGLAGQIGDLTQHIDNNNTGTLLTTNVNSTTQKTAFNSYALELLERMTAFIRRNAHVGSRWVDQSLARFGVRPSDSKMLRSTMLGSYRIPIQVSDVMCTADGSSASSYSNLGDYAGKGVGFGDGHFHYESDEFGYLIVISSIFVNQGYFQGRCRHVLRLNKLDFFTPEFDSIGMQAIRNDELFAQFKRSDNFTDAQNYGGKPDGIFGYCPRYSDYKVAHDRVSGDFLCEAYNSGLDAFHLKRIIEEPSATTPLVNNYNFSVMNDSGQYDRIFNQTNNAYDHFYTIFHFDIQASRKMISIVDHLDVEGAGNTLDMAHYGQTV